MKLIVVAVTLALAAYASASYVPSTKFEAKYADKDFLVKQKFFFEILRNIHMPLKYDEYLPYTKTWVVDESKYYDFNQVVEFFNFYKLGYLEKGEVFSIYNHVYLKQTYLLFTFLYNSMDWDTYYKNVIWARENVNEGMFMYAVTLTVLHRSELQGIVLPAIYEIYPYYFFNTDIIRTATFKRLYDPKFGFYGNGKYNVIYSNYTMTYPMHYYNGMYSESVMNYFTEDIGLNSFYYYFMMDYPYFLGGDKFGLLKDRRGELYWFFHQQLIARYSLERFSNFMGPIKKLTWQFPLKTGYFSLLSYYNGFPFKSRDFNFMVRDEDYVRIDWIKDYEARIRKIIDDGFFLLSDNTRIDLRKPESIDYFGNLLNGNVDSLGYDQGGYIELFSRLVLSGNDYMTTKIWPSALMHFETTVRDPVFYQLYDRLLDLFYYFKSFLPAYTFEELNFKGVVIKDVVVDKLMTYFDFFDSDISNVIPLTNVEKYWDFNVFARQHRLNHKPFSYTLNVMSDYTGKAVVRTFLGPKFNSFYDLDFYKKYFFQLDYYLVDLVSGSNSLVRNSRDFYWSVKDRTQYTDLYKKIMGAYNGQDKFILDMSEAHCGFPDRLILPKGLPSGLQFQFYFIVTPYFSRDTEQFQQYGSGTFDRTYMCGVGSGGRYLDGFSMGYPFDRQIDYSYFYTKNMIFKDVFIYHTDDIKTGLPVH